MDCMDGMSSGMDGMMDGVASACMTWHLQVMAVPMNWHHSDGISFAPIKLGENTFCANFSLLQVSRGRARDRVRLGLGSGLGLWSGLGLGLGLAPGLG